MKKLFLTCAALLLLASFAATSAWSQACLAFDPYCDGLELEVNNGVITGFWRNVDCAGTDVPVGGNVMDGPVGFGGYVICEPTTDPCPSGMRWAFYIDTPLDNTMQMYQFSGGWNIWIDPLNYNLSGGPCPFGPQQGTPVPSWTRFNLYQE